MNLNLTEIADGLLPLLAAHDKEIPLLQHLSSPGIKGLLKHGDAMQLQHVLATEFGLTDLDIRGCRQGPDFDIVINGLLLNKEIDFERLSRVDARLVLEIAGAGNATSSSYKKIQHKTVMLIR